MKINGQSIRTTGEHPFYLVSRLETIWGEPFIASNSVISKETHVYSTNIISPSSSRAEPDQGPRSVFEYDALYGSVSITDKSSQFARTESWTYHLDEGSIDYAVTNEPQFQLAESGSTQY
jgi:hypothetical protein